MDFVLKVTPEELITAAQDISKQISNVEQAFRNTGNTISNSLSYWEGDASRLHQKKYKDLEPEIAALLEKLKKRPVALLKMAGLYKETETLNTQEAQKLPDNIF